jgi:hypothetical protein
MRNAKINPFVKDLLDLGKSIQEAVKIFHQWKNIPVFYTTDPQESEPVAVIDGEPIYPATDGHFTVYFDNNRREIFLKGGKETTEVDENQLLFVSEIREETNVVAEKRIWGDTMFVYRCKREPENTYESFAACVFVNTHSVSAAMSYEATYFSHEFQCKVVIRPMVMVQNHRHLVFFCASIHVGSECKEVNEFFNNPFECISEEFFNKHLLNNV